MIGLMVHALSRAEEGPERTPEQKKFQQLMGVSCVRDLLRLRKVATFKNVQVMKFVMIVYHLTKRLNSLFLDILLTYMIVVHSSNIFGTLQFLI